MSQMEINRLRSYLSNDEGWRDLGYVGGEAEGFETIDEVELDEGRWYTYLHIITKSESGKLYRWNLARGLTEVQDNEYYDEEDSIKEVTATTKTIVVAEYVEV